MECPKCYLMMFECEGGYECDGCGYFYDENSQPCPEGVEGEPCYAIDNEWGGSECGMCGRDMRFGG